MLAIRFIKRHATTPKIVGKIAATAVHFMLPVSFFTVSRVVVQGECISENTITQRAVTGVQPFEVKISEIRETSPISVSAPDEV